MSAVARSLPHQQRNATLTRVTTPAGTPVDAYDDREADAGAPAVRWAGRADAWVRVRRVRRQAGQRSEATTERTVEIPAVCALECGDTLHVTGADGAQAWRVMDVSEVPVIGAAGFVRCVIERG